MTLTAIPVLALHPATGIAFGALIVAGLVGALLTLIAWAAYHRTREPFLKWLIAAFVVATAKSFFIAWALYTNRVFHQDLELYDAIADVAILLLIAMPFLLPQRRGPDDGTAAEVRRE